MKSPFVLRSRRHRQRGYTLVELMMALALFTVGVLGVISMQKLMLVSNMNARDVAIAEHIAQSWAAQLEMDATAWNVDLSNVDWLSGVDGGWIRPTYIDNRAFGAAFDELGNPLTDSDADVAQARFCSNVRLTWLYPDRKGADPSNNGTMRAEIRVFWQRDSQPTLGRDNICKTGVPTATIGQAYDVYHFVYHTAAVRQHAS